MDNYKRSSEYTISAFQICRKECGEWKGNEVRRLRKFSRFSYKKKGTLKNMPLSLCSHMNRGGQKSIHVVRKVIVTVVS